MPKNIQELMQNLRDEISQLEEELDKVSKPVAGRELRGMTRKAARAQKQSITNIKQRLETSKKALSDLAREAPSTGYDVGAQEGPLEPLKQPSALTGYDVGEVPAPSEIMGGPEEMGPAPGTGGGGGAAEGGPRKFTNRPELAGKEGWQFASGEPSVEPQRDINVTLGPGGEIQAPQGVTAEQLQILQPGFFKGGMSAAEVKEAGKKPAAVAGGKPPEGFQPTDYTRRSDFEDVVFKQIGGNPFSLDPNEEAQKMDQHLPQLFDHVFQGQVIWADRGNLNKDQQKFWQDVVKKFHADNYYKAKGQRDKMISQYNFMMNRFDNEAKAKEAAMKKFRESRKAPELKQMENEKGEVMWHKWDEDKQEWLDTGKGTLTAAKGKKAEARQEYTDAVSLVKWLAKEMGDDEFAGIMDNPEMLKKYPALAEAFGKKVTDPRMKELFDAQMDIIYKTHGITGEAPKKAPTKSDKGEPVETRIYNGRTLAKYADGSIEWLD